MTKDWLPVGQRLVAHWITRHSAKEDDWLTLSPEKLGIKPHRSILPASAIYRQDQAQSLLKDVD